MSLLSVIYADRRYAECRYAECHGAMRNSKNILLSPLNYITILASEIFQDRFEL
jgi:hypothetical protein